MTKKLFTKIELLEKQIAEEVKEKYALYKRIKELNEEIRALKNIVQRCQASLVRTRYKGIGLN